MLCDQHQGCVVLWLVGWAPRVVALSSLCWVGGCLLGRFLAGCSSVPFLQRWSLQGIAAMAGQGRCPSCQWQHCRLDSF